MVYFDIFKYMYIILTFKFYTPIANRYLSPNAVHKEFSGWMLAFFINAWKA